MESISPWKDGVMLDLNDIAIFVRVAHLGLLHAARSLAMPVSTVSRQ